MTIVQLLGWLWWGGVLALVIALARSQQPPWPGPDEID